MKIYITQGGLKEEIDVPNNIGEFVRVPQKISLGWQAIEYRWDKTLLVDGKRVYKLYNTFEL